MSGEFAIVTIFVKLNYYLLVKMQPPPPKKNKPQELLVELLQNQNHLEESQLELLNSIYLKGEKKHVLHICYHRHIHRC